MLQTYATARLVSKEPQLTAAIVREACDAFRRIYQHQPSAIAVHPTREASARELGLDLPVVTNAGCLSTEFWLQN